MRGGAPGRRFCLWAKFSPGFTDYSYPRKNLIVTVLYTQNHRSDGAATTDSVHDSSSHQSDTPKRKSAHLYRKQVSIFLFVLAAGRRQNAVQAEPSPNQTYSCFLHIAALAAALAEKRPTNRRFRAIGGGAGLAFFGFYDTIKREKGPNPSQTGPCLPCRPSTPSKLLIF